MKVKEKSNRQTNAKAQKSEPDIKILDHAPEPHGKNDQQLDTDLDNY